MPPQLSGASGRWWLGCWISPMVLARRPERSIPPVCGTAVGQDAAGGTSKGCHASAAIVSAWQLPEVGCSQEAHDMHQHAISFSHWLLACSTRVYLLAKTTTQVTPRHWSELDPTCLCAS
ncbi:hypothetical protein QBC35DRAFT_469467 [Podospora australis]|uniref:Secreted protein n=1 Tax=Podospora australis TaxID=1536484 RepID=A0AAN6X350_9PEZI|nr:hypothetical protein QBC35DRAFT_469467 [Podospora australis]